jgi:iron complex transport system substrate-binding protein
VAQDGRVVYIPENYDDALQFSTVLSLEYALEGIVPELQSALGIVPASACEAGFRLISHAMGETCVPEDVQRVVALEWSYVEDILALGAMPVGVADIAGYNNWVKIAPQLDDTVADVGTRQEPNLEVLASLAPDLIIASSLRVANNYEALQAIAPVLVFDSYPVDVSHYEEMTNTFTTIGVALNREAEAQAVLDDMVAYFALAGQALADAGRAGETFILAQTFLSSEVPTFRLFTINALAVQVLEQMGLSNAWGDAAQPYGFTTVDFEAFVSIPDTNFFYIAQPDYQPTLVASPLWGALPFVLSDRAYWLGGDVWLFGGPLSMQVLVDTILGAMNVALPEVTPE